MCAGFSSELMLANAKDKYILMQLSCSGIFSVMLLDVLIFFNAFFFFFPSAPAFSLIYIGGSVEIPNLTYTNDLNDPSSQKFLLQAEAIQNYVSPHIGIAVI